MANIVVDLSNEAARVRALLPQLDVRNRAEAERSLRFAERALQQPNLGEMYESLEELQAIDAKRGQRP
jgi:hypothetical protein